MSGCEQFTETADRINFLRKDANSSCVAKIKFEKETDADANDENIQLDQKTYLNKVEEVWRLRR